MTVISKISMVMRLVLLQCYESYHLLELSVPDMLLVVNTSCVPEFCYQSVLILFGTSMSGYTLLSTSQTAEVDFDAK